MRLRIGADIAEDTWNLGIAAKYKRLGPLGANGIDSRWKTFSTEMIGGMRGQGVRNPYESRTHDICRVVRGKGTSIS